MELVRRQEEEIAHLRQQLESAHGDPSTQEHPPPTETLNQHNPEDSTSLQRLLSDLTAVRATSAQQHEAQLAHTVALQETVAGIQATLQTIQVPLYYTLLTIPVVSCVVMRMVANQVQH